MIVEPLAGDSFAESIIPVSRVYYGFSTMICAPGGQLRKLSGPVGNTSKLQSGSLPTGPLQVALWLRRETAVKR
jgi:hypothetical protein